MRLFVTTPPGEPATSAEAVGAVRAAAVQVAAAHGLVPVSDPVPMWITRQSRSRHWDGVTGLQWSFEAAARGAGA